MLQLESALCTKHNVLQRELVLVHWSRLFEL